MSDITRTGLAGSLDSSSFDSASAPTPGVSTVEIAHSDRPSFADVQSSRAQAGVDLKDVRMDMVARVKAQIAAGTYETPEKLGLAIDRMLGR